MGMVLWMPKHAPFCSSRITADLFASSSSFSSGSIKTCSDFIKPRRRTSPFQFIHALEELDVGSKCGQLSEQQRAVPLAAERVC